MMADDTDSIDLNAPGKSAVSYWCEETLNNPDSDETRQASELVYGRADPEKLLRAAADLWVDQPPTLAGYRFDELDYVELVLAAQSAGVAVDGMAEHLRQHVIDCYDSEADAARVTLHLCRQQGHDPAYPDPPTVADTYHLTAADIEAIRSYAMKRTPGIELVETGNGRWYSLSSS